MEFDATFIVSVISFIVFVLVMNKILYKPIIDVIEKRSMLYKQNDNEVLTNDKEAEKILSKRDEKIKNAKRKSHEITLDGINNAKETKDKIVQNAREDIKKEYNARKTEMNEEINSVKDEIRNNIDDISSLIASKIFKEKI